MSIPLSSFLDKELRIIMDKYGVCMTAKCVINGHTYTMELMVRKDMSVGEAVEELLAPIYDDIKTLEKINDEN